MSREAGLLVAGGLEFGMLVLVICVALAILSALIWVPARPRSSVTWCFALINAIVLTLCGLLILRQWLDMPNLEAAVIYHLRVGMEQAGYGDFWREMTAIAAYLLMVLVCAALPLLPRYRLSLGIPKSIANRLSVALSTFAILLGPGGYWYSSGNLVAEPPAELNETFRDQYVSVIQLPAADQPKSLIYVYLESLERTYFNEAIFPGLVPNLKRLEAAGLSFAHVKETPYTNWTIAGMVASQCGVPLLLPESDYGQEAHYGNAMGGISAFMPNANCMGDLLKTADYQLRYLGGASLKFAGKGNFYLTHGFDETIGIDELADQMTGQECTNAWGLCDDELFQLAERHLLELQAGPDPYALVMLTLDTHAPRGMKSRSCGPLQYGDGDNPILNAVHCTDLLVGQLVDRLTAKGYLRNAVLVVASDHLSNRNTATELMNRGWRQNLFFALGADITAKRIQVNVEKVDLAPVVLNLLGYDVPRLGFGISPVQGVTEIVPPTLEIDWNQVTNSSQLSRYLWSFPHLTGDITLASDRGELKINDTYLSLPTLILLSEDLRIASIHPEMYSATQSAQTLLDRPGFQRFIWADTCGTFADIADEAPSPAEDQCLLYGALAGEELFISALQPDDAVESDLLTVRLANAMSTVSPDLEQRRRSSLTVLLGN